MQHVHTAAYGSLHTDAHTQKHRCLHHTHTHTDGQNTDTWLALKHCSVCIPLPLCTHPLPSTKPPLNQENKNTKKEAKRGQQAASILLPPFLPFLHFCVLNVYLPPSCEKRGMWTDRVRKERNLAEGKGAKAFKVRHRAVTKAS